MHVQVAYFSNRDKSGPQRLMSGVYGLSNALLDSSWPKVLFCLHTNLLQANLAHHRSHMGAGRYHMTLFDQPIVEARAHFLSTYI